MLRYLFILSLALSFLACNKDDDNGNQPPEETCIENFELTDFYCERLIDSANYFTVDRARYLMTEFIYEEELSQYQNLVFDTAQFNIFLRIFDLIYDRTDIPARDTLVNQLAFHQFNFDYRPFQFHLAVDTTQTWVNQYFINEQALTDNPTFNEFSQYYGLFIKGESNGIYELAYSWPQINHYALADSLRQFNGIQSVNFIDANVPTKRVLISLTCEGHLRITFWYGWANCDLGCLKNRQWVYEISKNCDFNYMGSFGDLLN